MSHSSTSRRGSDAASAARKANRVAAGAQAAAQRPAHVDALAVAVALARGACAAAASPAAGAPSAGTAAPARRLQRIEALAPQQLLVAGERRAPRARGLVAPPARRAPADVPPRVSVACRRLRGAALDRRGSGVGGAKLVGSDIRPSPDRRRSTKNTGSKAVHLRRVGHEHRARGPVQATSRDRPRRAPAPAANPARSAPAVHRQPGVVQPPRRTRRQRRQVELDRLDPESGLVTSIARHELRSSPAARTHAPGPRRTSGPSRACARSPPRRARSTPSRLRAASQSIASAMPGRLLDVASRASARRRWRPARPASPTRRGRGGGRSRPRAAALG